MDQILYEFKPKLVNHQQAIINLNRQQKLFVLAFGVSALITTFAALLVSGITTGIKRECSVILQLSRSCKLHNGISILKPLFKQEREGGKHRE